MKNIFKQIKSIFTLNREYFIKCTLMTFIVASVFGLVVGLSVPVSAEDESTGSGQIIIPAGIYEWSDSLSRPSLDYVYEVNGTLPEVTLNGVTVIPQINSIHCVFDTSLDGGSTVIYYNVSALGTTIDLICYTNSLGWNAAHTVFPNDNVPAGYGQIFTLSDDLNSSEDFSSWFAANTVFDEPATATITAGTYYGIEVPSSASFNVSFLFTSDSYEFDTFYVCTDYITYRMLTGDVRSVNAFDFSSDLWTINYETITVPADQTLPADFVTWFNANYTTQIIPEPEPTYTISAGYYKARDSFATSRWNVSNDSIRIRYYNDAANVQAYEVVDGISFISYYTDSGIHYASEIYYADKDVFTDGWNIDGAKNIQVLQDVTVSSDFYTVFNNVYAPSSEGTNEFDSGYAAGYVDGRSDGYDIGYRQGYAEGLSDGDTNLFVDIIGGTLAAVDSFTIFGGFSLLDLISTLLGGMALVWILKLLAGG